MTEKHYLQVELEKLLQDGTTIWEFLQRGSLDGVWYWDLEYPDREWMSPEMWQLFGIDPQTKRHAPEEWQDLIFEEDLAIAIENFKKHCEDPSHPYDQIVRYRHADGSTVWVRCRGVAIRDDKGKPIRMLGAHSDMTAVKRAEAEMEAANEELASFAYSISHDLKSPANTVQMLIDEVVVSDEGGLSEDQRNLLALSQKTISRMRGMVDSLLSYTQTIGEEGTTELVDPNAIISSVLDNLKEKTEGIEADFQINTLPTIRGIHFQLFILVQNLLENSIKYRCPDRPLVVDITERTNVGRDSIMVCISDNGIGIDPERRDQVFRMFKRLHREDEIPGVGLGLSLCQKIMRNHNGKIELDESESGGTTVKLYFPRPKY